MVKFDMNVHLTYKFPMKRKINFNTITIGENYIFFFFHFLISDVKLLKLKMARIDQTKVRHISKGISLLTAKR